MGRECLGGPLSALCRHVARYPNGREFCRHGGADNPAVVAQSLLSAKFGIEGSPTLLLVAVTSKKFCAAPRI